MARNFEIPGNYQSDLITQIKTGRNTVGQRGKDFTPTVVDLGKLVFKVARHFGFCFGVKNAIEIAYRAVAENPGRRIYLLSEMIHNPHVNADLRSHGVQFLMSTSGEQLIPFSNLSKEDIVIVPAFGTTVEIFQQLQDLGLNLETYDATCPFVEKVWKRSNELGKKGFSIVIHGKAKHEETRATFSHSVRSAPSVVVRDEAEAELLAGFIKGEISVEHITRTFANYWSEGFMPERDLVRIGVVNQTTMLATETQKISSMLREAMLARYGAEELSNHFADTRDTLCYATSENQQSVYALMRAGGDLALVVGGYNSSNTSHLVEICEEHLPTYYIKDAGEIVSRSLIRHLDFRNMKMLETSDWLPDRAEPIDILVTAGASCPDSLVEEVMARVAGFFGCGFRAAELKSEAVL